MSCIWSCSVPTSICVVVVFQAKITGAVRAAAADKTGGFLVMNSKRYLIGAMAVALAVSLGLSACGGGGTSGGSGGSSSSSSSSSLSVGTEISIPTDTAGAKYGPYGAGLDSGNIIIAWGSLPNFDNGANSYRIRGQLFSPSGQKIASEFAFLDNIDNQTQATLSALGSGFVLSWPEKSGTITKVVAQRYDASAAKIGGVFDVYLPAADNATAVNSARLANGNVIITWQNSGDRKIYGQLIDPSGAKVGGGFSIAIVSNPSKLITGNYHRVQSLTGGGFIVEWNEVDATDQHLVVKAQRFAADGTVAGSAIKFNDPPQTDEVMGAIIPLSTGGFAATWSSRQVGGSHTDERIQLYDAAGNTVGTETVIDGGTTDLRDPVNGAPLGNGRFLVAADVTTTQGATVTEAVVLQVFDSSAKLETAVTVSAPDVRAYAPFIIRLATGALVVCWTTEHPGGATDAVARFVQY